MAKMRSRTSQWFQCKIKYEKVMEDGLRKEVTELYVIEASSYTEAEARINKEMLETVNCPFEVKDITKATYKEVFFVEEYPADRFYKAKLQFITIDEKSEQEKRSNVWYLVQADNFNAAVNNIVEVMKGTMIDYVIYSITETAIIDVFEVESEKNPNDVD